MGAGSGESIFAIKSLLATHNKEKGMGGANRGRHSDPKVDALIDKALATVDSPARGKILAEATELAVGKITVLFLFIYQVIHGVLKLVTLIYLEQTNIL